MGSTTTDLALYLKYTSIPTRDPSVNQNKPDSDHQSSRWFSPSIFSTQLLPLRPASTSLRTLSCPKILLHGCQVPRLLHHHHRLLARTNRRHLRRLLFPQKVDPDLLRSILSVRFRPFGFVRSSHCVHHESLDGWEPGWLSLLICAYLHL